MIKKIIFFSTLIHCCYLEAQITINAFAKVTAVSSSSVLSLSNVNQTSHTFSVGGKVVIMQMQDDVIGSNTSNNSSFGNLSTIANAGKYEIVTISALTPTSGSPTSLTLTSMLANTYNTGSNSSVQLITLRNLGANYTTTSNITTAAWDGNVGGVLALEVTNTLTLNHSISADGMGFRGGAVSSNFEVGCTNTVYISSSTNDGSKGEGIYKNTNAGFVQGRGKILSGGGGGTQDNAGGGGGGNYTAGGTGGYGWTCTSANSGYGLGGITLSTSISSSRIFMGGGGGGGQQNNSTGTSGGNGGGIILLKAGTILTNTVCSSPIKISADGLTAGNSSGGGNDGCGGGGAGGSIILQASNFSINAACPLTVAANAGNGGNVTNSGAHGGGGGGAQGIVIYSSAQPTLNVTTQAINGSPGTDNSGGTTSASSGTGVNGSGILTLSSGPLPIELVNFSAEAEKDKVKLQWLTASEKNNSYFSIERSADGFNYSVIGTLAGAGTSASYKSYQFFDLNPTNGLNYYRLKQTDLNQDFKYSKIIYVGFNEEPEFSIFPNPVGKDQLLSLQVEKGGDGLSELFLLDFTGKELFHETFEKVSQKQISLNSLNIESGIYLLKLQNSGRSKIQKLIVR